MANRNEDTQEKVTSLADWKDRITQQKIEHLNTAKDVLTIQMAFIDLLSSHLNVENENTAYAQLNAITEIISTVFYNNSNK